MLRGTQHEERVKAQIATNRLKGKDKPKRPKGKNEKGTITIGVPTLIATLALLFAGVSLVYGVYFNGQSALGHSGAVGTNHGRHHVTNVSKRHDPTATEQVGKTRHDTVTVPIVLLDEGVLKPRH